MNKLTLVFVLFSVTVFFGISVSIVQLVTDTFLFPFDSGNMFESDEQLDSEQFNFDPEAVKKAYDESEAAAIADMADLSSEFTWTCGDSTSIDGAWANDGDCDCTDCSDESVFKCSNGQLIALAYVNDGDCDCLENCEDEAK